MVELSTGGGLCLESEMRFLVLPYAGRSKPILKLTPITLMEKSAAYKRPPRRPNLSGATRNLLTFTLGKTLNWEDSISFISKVEAKKVTTRFKHIKITFFTQEKYENGLFISKYDKYSTTTDDMCTKPCSGPIIRRITKWITGCHLYTPIN